MKKLMKKVSLLSMGMLFLLVNFNVKAYTQDIEPNRSIVFNEYLVNYEQNYITLKNELKDKNAVVNQQYIKFNVEELIDKRMFSNYDEIIIIDINFDEGLINLEYLCDSLNYNYLSYSNDVKEKLLTFTNYVIRKSNN